MYRNNFRITTQDLDYYKELLEEGLIVTIANRKKKVDFETINLMIWAEQVELKINEFTTREEISEFLEPMGLEDYYIDWICSLKNKYYTLNKPDRSKIHKHQYGYLFED